MVFRVVVGGPFRGLRGSFAKRAPARNASEKPPFHLIRPHFLAKIIPKRSDILAIISSATKLIRLAETVRRVNANVLGTIPCLSRTVLPTFNQLRVPLLLLHRPTLPYLQRRHIKTYHRDIALRRALHLHDLPHNKHPLALLRTTRVQPLIQHWRLK